MPTDAVHFRVYIASSVDGFIATADGGVGWLDDFQSVEDYGYAEFIAGIGTLVLGRATYDQACGFGLPWPYPELRSIVLTSRPLDGDPPRGVERMAAPDGVAGLVAALRAESSGDVWVMGGAQTIRSFLDAGAIDALDIFVMPVLLGDGVPLFERSGRGLRDLTMAECRAYPDGVVRLSYASIDPWSTA